MAKKSNETLALENKALKEEEKSRILAEAKTAGLSLTVEVLPYQFYVKVTQNNQQTEDESGSQS